MKYPTNMEAKVYKATGEIFVINPVNGKTFSYDELSSIVGGFIERVDLPNGKELWVNEEGKLKGLPLNVMASAIWKNLFAGYAIGADDYVVGDVLICDPALTTEQ